LEAGVSVGGVSGVTAAGVSIGGTAGGVSTTGVSIGGVTEEEGASGGRSGVSVEVGGTTGGTTGAEGVDEEGTSGGKLLEGIAAGGGGGGGELVTGAEGVVKLGSIFRSIFEAAGVLFVLSSIFILINWQYLHIRSEYDECQGWLARDINYG
jgi:hypothetical protein